MEAVTYKCPNCDAALVFDPVSGMLFCDHCVDYFRPEFLNPVKEKKIPQYWNGGFEEEEPESDPAPAQAGVAAWEAAWEASAAKKKEDIAVEEEVPEQNMMEMRVYHCKSCGAEIMSGDVEVSKFCSFCGQPAIFFDRVSKEKKPDRILPFMITKEEALQRAKKKFETAQFLDESLKNVEVDSVYGIYMPYWVFDSFFGMMARIRVTSDKRTNHYEDAMTGDKDVIFDASRRFHDDVSILLNPFDMKDSVPFSPAYLSGFYADKCDVDSRYREKEVRAYLKNAAVEAVLNRTPGVPGQTIRELYNLDNSRFKNYEITCFNEQFRINKTIYAFLPVYFITFLVEGKPVILLENGQTGKIVGNIPVDEEKVKHQRKIDRILMGAIGAGIGGILTGFLPIFWALGIIVMAGTFGVLSGLQAKKIYEERYAKTNSGRMFAISKNRGGLV